LACDFIYLKSNYHLDGAEAQVFSAVALVLASSITLAKEGEVGGV
jgi:hypothetical protein